MRSHRHARLHRALDDLLASTDAIVRRASDPVSLVHRYERPDDQEVAGLVASTLAFGNAKTIVAKASEVLARLGPSPARRIRDRSPTALCRDLSDITHRVFTGADVARLLSAAGRLRRRRGSLGAVLLSHFESTGNLREATARLRDDLVSAAPSDPKGARRRPGGFGRLLADPRAGSPCKRWNLWLRWMVRGPDGVDLGIWDLPPSVLVVPLDTHVFRISRNLGLTRRSSPSWRAAEEITERLRAFDPADPVRYDFALCHLGIARDCPSRRDPVRCNLCILHRACLATGHSPTP